MRRTIETAPRNGVFVILEDATQGTFAVARWSDAQWIDDDDEPVRFNPTHWDLPQGLKGEAAPLRTGSPEQRLPAAAAGAIAEPAAEPVRHATTNSQLARKPLGIVAMAACLLVGVAFAPLLYRSEPGLQLLHWMGLDAESGLKQALEQERARATRLAHEMTTTSDAAALARETSERTLAGVREALKHEQSRAEKLAVQLVKAESDGAAQTARTREAIDDGAKERDRIVSELREALKAQEVRASEAQRKIEAETVQANQAGMLVAEALQKERKKTEELHLALATTRREAEVQAASARSATGEVTRLKEANTRAAETLREGRVQTEKLATELAAARRDLQAQAALLVSAKAAVAGLKEAAQRSADEQRQALLHEQDKTAKLTAVLTEARSGLLAQTKAKAADDVIRDNQLAAVKSELLKAKEDVTAARAALHAEHIRIKQVELIAAQAAVEPEEYRSAAPTATAIARFSPASASAVDAQTTRSLRKNAEQSGPQAVRLIARATLLLDQGNIGAARNMLDRAAELGSAEALFWLAETYDPLLLQARNTIGTQSDVTKARALYDRALAAGVSEARSRLESLEK